MRPSKILPKVTAFLTRPGANDSELLVFRHPTAGIQLPSGTVELGEDVTTAVLREVQEETGLQEVTLVGNLGVVAYELPPDQRAVLRLTKVFVEPAHDASGTGMVLQRGSAVRYLGLFESFAEIVYEVYDHYQQPPVLLVGQSGWVRASLLTRHVERHFFHLTTTAVTPDTWSHAADNHIFQLYWTPLKPRPQLITGQDEWLARVYDSLLSSVTKSQEPVISDQ
jgi:8-oxo-dGTP pyrophosphatase MutT (NUDIX family)